MENKVVMLGNPLYLGEAMFRIIGKFGVEESVVVYLEDVAQYKDEEVKINDFIRLIKSKNISNHVDEADLVFATKDAEDSGKAHSMVDFIEEEKLEIIEDTFAKRLTLLAAIEGRLELVLDYGLNSLVNPVSVRDVVNSSKKLEKEARIVFNKPLRNPSESELDNLIEHCKDVSNELLHIYLMEKREYITDIKFNEIKKNKPKEGNWLVYIPSMLSKDVPENYQITCLTSILTKNIFNKNKLTSLV